MACYFWAVHKSVVKRAVTELRRSWPLWRLCRSKMGVGVGPGKHFPCKEGPHAPRAQDAIDLVAEVERAVQRYSGGMGWLGQRLPLPGPPQLLLLTHRRVAGAHASAQPLGGEGAEGGSPGQEGQPPGGAGGEAVAHTAPQWGRPAPVPAAWDAALSQVPV